MPVFRCRTSSRAEGGGHTKIWRSIANGGPPGVAADNTIVTTGDGAAQASQFPQMRVALQNAHNSAHDYIAGSIGQPHFSFHDPFVFLLHSNVDRLWARWQMAAGRAWRLDPNQVYGNDGISPSITGNLESLGWQCGSATVGTA